MEECSSTEDRLDVTSTEAQNEFGRILESARSGKTVFISRHDRPAAVLISVERFHAMAGLDEINLANLTREFDELLAQMQSPDARAAMARAFHATPEELGEAAVAEARHDR